MAADVQYTSYYTLCDPDAPGVGAAERKRIASIPAAWQAVKPGRDAGPQAPTIRRCDPACFEHASGIVVVMMPAGKE